MPLPNYPTDPTTLRRTRYAVDGSSPAPLVGATPDEQVLTLDSIRALRIGLQAAPGETLTGTGTLRMYLLDSEAGAADWGRTPDLDIIVPGEAAGERTFWLPDVPTLVRAGRMHIRTQGVGTSGGGQVTIHVQAWSGAL
jgi:hypothetical protein